MASDGQKREDMGMGDEERHAYGAEQTASPEVEGVDDVAADNDASQRASGEAGGFAGAGVPGAGGRSGGTPDAGGLGLPGGVRRLGAGPAPTRDAGEGGTPLTGGLGTPGNAAAGGSEAHPLATPDTEPQGPAHAMEYPHTPQPPSERNRSGHLSVAGGSAGSGVGGADLLDENSRADIQDSSADAEAQP